MDKINRTRSRVGAFFALTMGLLMLPTAALAQAVADPAVGTALGDATGTITATVVAALPVILGVTVAFLMIPIGKKLLKSAKS